MNLDHLASFLAVIRTGNFRSAARERGISQGAVSQHIKKLENFLKARLLNRAHQGCEPTPEGAKLIPHAESLLRLNERALRSIFDTRIVVGASSNIGTYILQPYVRRFLDSCEHKCDIDIQIHRNPVVAEKLEHGEIDVALMEWWDHRADYSSYRWRQEELIIIVPPNHAWAESHAISVSMLKSAPMLGGESGTGTGRLLLRYFGEAANDIQITMQLGSTEAVKQWVKAGLGVSLVLASTVKRELFEGSLCGIPLEGNPPCKNLFVIWRDSLFPESLPRRFADSLRLPLRN